MEKSSKRGKIPQSDWPMIMARYEAGETLASIARTYDCSPPAISYIVSRSRARQPAAETASAPVEPQLLKAPASEPAAALIPISIATPAAAIPEIPPVARIAAQSSGEIRPSPTSAAAEARIDTRPAAGQVNGNGHANGYGAAAPREREAGFPGLPPRAAATRPVAPPQPLSAPPNGDRRTLHLSLGGPSAAQGNAANERQGYPNGAAGDGHAATERSERRYDPEPSAASHRGPGDDRYNARGSQGRYGYPGDAQPERSLEPVPPRQRDGQAREAIGSFIDSELRARVDGDIAAFLAAFDGALAQDSADSRIALREATDRLLRAGARTRIELERLEARVPLTSRDNARPDPVWRTR